MAKLGKRIRRIILYTTAGLILAVLVLPLILEPLLNTPAVKRRISAAVKERTGISLDPDQMVFQLFPHLYIGFRDVETTLLEPARLTVKELRVVLDGPALLRGEILVRGIRLDRPDVSIKPALAGDSQAGAAVLPPFSPHDLARKLFDALPPSQDHLDLVLNQLTSDYFDAMDANLMMSRQEQRIILSAKIRNLLIRKTDFSRVEGLDVIRADSLAADTVGISLRLDPEQGFKAIIKCAPLRVSSGALRQPVLCSSLDLGISMTGGRIKASVKPMTFTYPKGSVGVEFLYDPNGGDIRLTFTGRDIHIAQAGEASLAIAGSDPVVRGIFDILRSGTAKDIVVRFKDSTLGTLLKGNKMILEGNAEDAVVKIPETPLMPTEVAGSARIENGVLSIKAHNGLVEQSRIRNGWVDIDIINHDHEAPFKGEFDLEVDLSTLPRVLGDLLPGTHLASELAGVSDVRGRVATRLGMEMNLGEKTPRFEVLAQNFVGTGRYNRLPLPITISRGRFHYKNDFITLNGFSGRIGANPITGVNTGINLGKENFTRFTAQSARIRIADFYPWLLSHDPIRNFTAPVQHLQGEVDVTKLEISGPALVPRRWDYRVSGTAGNVGVGFAGGTSNAVQSLSGRFDVSTGVIKGRDIKALITDLSWLEGERVTPEQAAGIRLPVVAEGGTLNVRRNTSRLYGRFLFETGPELFLELEGKTFPGMMPVALVFNDGEVSRASTDLNWTPGHPLLDFKGYFNTRSLEKLLKKDSGLSGLLYEITGGDAIKFHTDANQNLYVETDQINLDAIGASSGDTLRSLFERKKLFFETQKMTLGKYRFTNFTAETDFNTRRMDIRSFKAGLCGLDLSGNLNQDRWPPQKTRTRIRITTQDGENIQDPLSCLFPDLKLMEGRYDFTCDLAGEGPKKAIIHHLNGPVSLNAWEGRIYKLTLLSRILSVLNILDLPNITQQGFGFKSMVMEGQLRDGVIYLDKAVIDGDDMAITFTGWIAPFKDEMNLNCLVAPFKTIDTIIKYIPLVSTVLQGKLVSFPAKATGSLTDPVVVPLHPSAVGQGLINMMGNIIKSPVRIIESTQELIK